MLWSELKSIQVPTPTCVDLVRYSLKDNSGFTMFPYANKLEDRLCKECTRTCKKYRGLRWDYSKERLGESEKCVIVYANEGTLQLPNYQPSPEPSTAESPVVEEKIDEVTYMVMKHHIAMESYQDLAATLPTLPRYSSLEIK